MLCGSAMAADPLGTAVAVRPSVIGLMGAEQTRIVDGSDLYQGERIVTSAHAQVQIVFSDDTHMVVGPDSQLVIETYLLRNDKSVGKFAVKALGGTFRFITGNSAKPAYSIETPTGTIGVRGTQFDFTIDKQTGRTSIVLYQGETILCSNNGQCATQSLRCSVAEIGGDYDLQLIRDEADRLAALKSRFRYARSQGELLRDFHVIAPSGCLAPPSFSFGSGSHSSVPALEQIVPVPTAPPQAPSQWNGGTNNKGFGNGGDSTAEGATEANNPRNSHANK